MPDNSISSAQMTDEQLKKRVALIELRGSARELSLAFPHLLISLGLDESRTRVGDTAFMNTPGLQAVLMQKAETLPVFVIASRGIILAWRE
jgi:hypothetical protein